MKVGLHQGSVLSPPLFAVVIDVVSSEVLIAPTMEPLGRSVAEWSAILLDKGLKVNAGKFTVMVGSSGGKGVQANSVQCSGGKMIIKWPCGVCGKGVQANSVQCGGVRGACRW